MSTTNGAYWLTAADDETMQDEHGFIWRAMLDTIDVELRGRRVLDAGCNRGGFLRLLADHCGISQGCGFDPAAAAVDNARRLAGDRPLYFEPGISVPSDWSPFDVAFSHEVLYLVHDLPAHATTMRDALAPGGVYYAVEGIHADNPTMIDWHHRNAESMKLPPLSSLDELVGIFSGAGFDVAVGRLNVRFIPAAGHATSFPEALDYFYDHKVMFRLTKPAG